jgi:hypothetical protein
MPFLTAGMFRDGELAIEPFGLGRPGAVRRGLDLGLRRVRGSPGDRRGRGRARRGADRVCLVHSDFNPKNLLVDPATRAITG